MMKKPEKLAAQSKKRQTDFRGIVNGYRSGLEDKIADQLNQNGVQVQYESEKIHYSVPESQHTYTPDFKVPTNKGFFYLETKGRMTVSDRKKHLRIKYLYPSVDLRFVFSNSKQKLYKGSPTTYADWCTKNQFKFADKSIPKEWLSE